VAEELSYDWQETLDPQKHFLALRQDCVRACSHRRSARSHTFSSSVAVCVFVRVVNDQSYSSSAR
jgi:hypothetical protein